MAPDRTTSSNPANSRPFLNDLITSPPLPQRVPRTPEIPMAQPHADAAPVPPSPQVLQWLHRVIAPVYHDPQRTYTDVASALAGIRTLAPKTEIYTYENGATELLLHLSGTLQAIFRGSPFSVPVSLWIPHQYPKLPPMVFVTPQKDIAVRPGNHVDPSGRCYHPYLANWVNFSDRSNIFDLCEALRGVFSREPPVMARQSAQHIQQQSQPPPRPPRPQELGGARTPERRESAGVEPPPVPPLPSELAGSAVPAGMGSKYVQAPPTHQPTPPPVPPLPPHPGRQTEAPGPPPPPPQYRPQHYQSGPAPPPPPPKPRAPHPGEIPGSPHSPSPLSPHYTGRPASVHIPPQFPPQLSASPTQRPRPVSMQPPHPHPAPPPYPVAPPAKPTPQRSLLDESDDPAPTSAPAPSAAPPPPPNPEKDHLVTSISHALHNLAHSAHATTSTRLTHLAAQHQSLLAAESLLERERAELQHLSDACDKNADILRERIAAAERVVEEARRTEPPGVDECVVAPSVLHQQLYEVVADELAIEETVYRLGEALDAEKVGLEPFLKHVRVLAREQFLKKALARKIALSLGLEMDGGEGV